MRGEYLSATVPAEAFDELPPRARRIPLQDQRRILKAGTTSACAENTPGAASRSCAIWNYLRVRGEYPFDWAIGRTPWELPPRARRIQYELDVAELRNGTTSACAENTSPLSPNRDRAGNYLRVRGEYQPGKILSNKTVELPPRARRILAGAWF